jgi:hypothetical protein
MKVGLGEEQLILPGMLVRQFWLVFGAALCRLRCLFALACHSVLLGKWPLVLEWVSEPLLPWTKARSPENPKALL